MKFDELRDEMTERVLTAAQRMRRRVSFRQSAGMRKAAIKRSKFKKASPAKLRIRASRLARATVRKKLSGGTESEMSMSQKVQLDKRLEKKKSLINKMTKKLLKVVRKKEQEKFAKK